MHLDPRHEGHHHTANIKYGYIVFLLSLVHLAALIVIPKLPKYRHSLSTRSYWLPQIVGWSILLAVLGVANIDEWLENWLLAIKRFGRLGFCLLPFDIVLAYKYWPVENYLNNLSLHKWLSRIIVACCSIHGVGYLVKWILNGSFIHHVFKWDNLLGIIVFAAALLLVAVSVRYLRRQNYQLFYLVHNVTIGLFVVLIFFHARPPVTLFVSICGLLLAILVFIKFQTFNSTPSSLIEVPNSSFALVSFPWMDQNLTNFTPGCHVRLNYSNRNWKSWVFASHPFTAVTVPGASQTLDLIVKSGAFTLAKDVSYNLSSPYSSLKFDDNLVAKFDTAIIVCGGSGISMGIPVYKYLTKKLDVSLIWVTRSKADLFLLRHYSLLDQVEVYVTGTDAELTEADGEGHGLMQETIELQDLEESETKLANIRQGRPDLSVALASLTNSSKSGCVISCGPSSLVADCELWCRQNGVASYNEVYEM